MPIRPRREKDSVHRWIETRGLSAQRVGSLRRLQPAPQPCRMRQSMPDHNYFASLIWQIADLLRGPYRPPQYERVMLPMTVLRRFDCVLAPTKARVLAEHGRRQGGRLSDDALDWILNN